MGKISLYSGELIYWRGKWSKDSLGNDYVGKDEVNMEYFEDSFQKVPAKSVEQLVFILSKRIQENKELPYPVYIDWREVHARVIGDIPETSERFNKLAENL